MKKQLRDRLYPLVTPLLSLFIILASVTLFYYIKGYRFDFQTHEISTTGILSIDTIPSRSDLNINDKSYGKTPKSVTLLEGDYHLEIEKTGYHSWGKTISIIKGKSTSIYPWLIANTIKEEDLFSSSEEIDKNHIYQNDNSIFFTLYNDNKNTRSYEIWKFSTTSSAWNFTENPNKVLSFTIDTTSATTFTILPSPDSSTILFSITADTSKEIYLVDTDEENILTTLTPITLNGFSNYSIFWSNSSKFLLLESDSDLFSYDIETGIKYLITKKDEAQLYTFTTDNTGLIYLMTGEQEDPLYTYSLSQYLVNGTLQKEVISSIYFFTSDEYIKTYRENSSEFSLPFRNSESSTKTSGKVISFSVHEDVNGMFIKTEYAGYWYDLETSRFILVSPYPTDLISVSSIQNQLIFKNSNETGVLTFKIKDGETNQYIGKRYIWDKDLADSSDIEWVKTWKNVLLTDNGKTYISDYDGENAVEIYSDVSIFSAAGNDPSKVYISAVSKEGGFKIIELTVH